MGRSGAIMAAGMPCMMLAAVAVAASSASAQGAAEGPFGFREGMTVSEVQRLGAVASASPNVYRVVTAPKGRRDMENYLLTVTPKHGLCTVTAVGNNIDTSPFGSEVRGAFDDMKTALAAKYGPTALEFDFLESGSIWKDPNDFMIGLAKLERHLSAFWGTEAKPLGKTAAHLHTIELDTKALSSHVGYITIGYEFDNFTDCRAEVKGGQNAVL